ncbi:MAG: GNAT family N-acetyltransferase [Pseudomonadota bacterium]
MIAIPTLETERLILRPPMEADFEHEAEFYQSDRATFVGGPMAPELVWRTMATLVGHWAFRGFGMFGVEEKATGAYCGHVGPWFPHGWPEPEIGWTIMGHAEGRGIAREAAARARQFAYEDLGWTTAISLIDPRNVRSIALAERLGAFDEALFEHAQFGSMRIFRHPGPEAIA